MNEVAATNHVTRASRRHFESVSRITRNNLSITNLLASLFLEIFRTCAISAKEEVTFFQCKSILSPLFPFLPFLSSPEIGNLSVGSRVKRFPYLDNYSSIFFAFQLFVLKVNVSRLIYLFLK